MGTLAHTTWVGQMLRHLPGPLISLLDAWSQRVARRHAVRRQQAWLQRKAAKALLAPKPHYRPQPWRD
jgi:hypothetical protein